MAIVITGDLSWTGALVLFLEALDGGPAADVAGYAFTSSGDLEYSCSVPEPALAADRLLGTYRCVAETSGGVIAGVGYVTIGASTTSIRIRSEESVALSQSTLDLIESLILGNGTGSRTITITVNDGTTVLENALVRLTEVGSPTNFAYDHTNSSGVATLNLNDGNYTVSITKSGFQYGGTTLTVNGAETETYSMTAISLTPGTGEFTTGFLTAYDETGTVEVGALIYCELTKAPSGDTGFSYDSKLRTLTSITGGLVEIPGLIKGGTYRIWRGTRNSSPTANNLFLIPTSAGSTYELPSHIGRE